MVKIKTKLRIASRKPMTRYKRTQPHLRISGDINKEEVRNMELIFRATPTLKGEDAREVIRELSRKRSPENIKREKFLLEILDRVTK